MINKHKFSDALGQISVDTVERYLQAEQVYLQRTARRRRRLLVCLTAATLALIIALGALAIAFIPKTYDLNYEIPTHQFANTTVRVYYTDENGEVQSQRVRMPDAYENVFLTWKHLNSVGDEVQIIECQTQTEAVVTDGAVDPWDIFQAFMPAERKTATIKLTSALRDHPDAQTLLDSLRKTFAAYLSISPEDVSFDFIEQTDLPIGIAGELEFWHSLQPKTAIVEAGSTIQITVGMTNITLNDIEFTGSWSAFVPGAFLHSDSKDILPNDYPMTEEYQKYTLAPGQSREITYTFNIPEDAPCGEYDLVVGFEKQSFTFEKAVLVVAFGPLADPSAEFSKFMNTYGFDTTEPEAFRAAVQALTYNGVGLFDIMNAVDTAPSPGYEYEMYTAELFEYEYSSFSKDGITRTYQSSFFTKALPDGLTLPYGITPEDTLVEALCKMGHGEQNAQAMLEARKTVFFMSPLGSTSSLSLKFGANYVDLTYEYNGQSMTLRYREDSQSFTNLQIEAKFSGILQATFTSFRFDETVYTLSEEQRTQLSEMLARAQRIDDTSELLGDSTCIINGISFSYDSTEGLFCGNGLTIVLTEQDRLALGAMLSGHDAIYFDPDSIIMLDSPYDDIEHYAILSDTDRDQILAILNGGDWESGTPNVQPGDFTFTVDEPNARYEIHYNSQTGLFLCNGYYLNASYADMNTVNEIFGGYAVQLPELP